MQRRVDELRVDVGEAGELALVNVGNDQLVGRGQHGLRAGEELVKVFRPFAALKNTRKRRERVKCGVGGSRFFSVKKFAPAEVNSAVFSPLWA